MSTIFHTVVQQKRVCCARSSISRGKCGLSISTVRFYLLGYTALTQRSSSKQSAPPPPPSSTGLHSFFVFPKMLVSASSADQIDLEENRLSRLAIELKKTKNKKRFEFHFVEKRGFVRGMAM